MEAYKKSWGSPALSVPLTYPLPFKVHIIGTPLNKGGCSFMYSINIY